MRRTAVQLLLLAAGMMAAGCADGITDAGPGPNTLMGASARPGNGAEMVPITWTYRVAPTGTELLTCPNSDGSTAFLQIAVNYTVQGHVSHLGSIDARASSAEFTACAVTMASGVPVSATGDGELELVGANGDALYLEGVLTLVFADVEALGEWTITGGTGRYEGASGWLETREVPDEGSGASVGSGSGMITPPGMLKR